MPSLRGPLGDRALAAAGAGGAPTVGGELPFVDELSEPVAASMEATWAALLEVVRRAFGSAGSFARLLACDPASGTRGFAGEPGETLPGFRVVAAESGRRLALAGRHRFARYTLTFVLDDGRLRARTHAAFPGLHGALYRALVIGSGAHQVLTRRLLRAVARRAAAGRQREPGAR